VARIMLRCIFIVNRFFTALKPFAFDC